MTADARHDRPVDPARRALISTATWIAPVIASTFVPAAAQSGGTVPISKLRIGPDFAADNRHQYDPATQTNRGPLVVYVTALYDQNIVWWPTPDPSVAVLPYVVSVSGPLGSTTLSGTLSIAIGGYAQDVRWYPSETGYPIPAGTYTFTMTLYGSDGSASKTTTIDVT